MTKPMILLISNDENHFKEARPRSDLAWESLSLRIWPISTNFIEDFSNLICFEIFFPFEKIIILEHFRILYGFFALFQKKGTRKIIPKCSFLEHKNMIKSRHVINDHFLSNDPKSRSQSTLLWSIHVYFALFLEYFVNMLFFWSIHVYFALFLPIICNALYF